MRIVAGTAKRRNLSAPKGQSTRPTPDRVREALFSILGGRCDSWTVLDLFSGSGAVGLEALSRGARHVTFVEQSPLALRCLEENIACVANTPEQTTILRTEVSTALKMLKNHKFDLIFMDPPYAKQLVPQTLGELVSNGLVGPDTQIVAEHHKTQLEAYASDSLELVAQRTWGEVALAFFRTSVR